MLKPRKIIILLFAALLFFATGFLQADAEELAPGFDACMQEAETTGQENVCLGKAGKYWSKKLEEEYSKLMRECEMAPNPQGCKQELKKMQSGWIQYNTLMIKFLRKGLTREYEIESQSNINDALRFDAESTKKQYEMLYMLD